MRLWMIPLAATTLAVAFQASPAQAGLFSRHGGCHDNDCYASCAAPTDCCTQPTCAAPVECAPSCCAPAAPECCAPAMTNCATSGVYYDGCGGDVCCDGSTYGGCERECCLKRVGRRLWHLEQRKNACLRRTFLGRCHRDCNDQCYDGYCAPHYYYQSNYYGGYCGGGYCSP